ncbi:MAG: exostosin family protein, partial [Anaerolineales bacterium]|nr:exostosin family protein [Anaerolineales bacterium]
MLLYRNNPFCELSDYPVYPPYANGSYLEDYFAMRFLSEGLQEQVDRKYIPVLWTPYYIKRNMAGQPNIPNDEPLQSWMDSLDPNDKYFVVSQHDDAPMHRLPEDTLVFSAGGNYVGKNTKPIPLLCSKIPNHLIPNTEERDILVSFVGSDTHPIRRRSIDSINGKDRVVVKSRGWNNVVPTNDLTEFLFITSRSEFCLCPRGYGKSSFRMYECMQMGTIPVYVSDDHYLPWLDELD